MADAIDKLLVTLRAGDDTALKSLVELTYQDFRQYASRMLRTERPNHTLQTTALVHEAWLRLLQANVPHRSPDRNYFYRASLEAMRRVLVDYERKRATLKRGGKFVRTALDESVLAIEETGIAWVDWRDALECLAVDFPRQALAVELRYMLAMPIAEIASRLAVAESTVHVDLELGRAWLYLQLRAP
jgi:RNA polymerase sigma factor (TIGR02999 family)